jgi:signal transduction histidine kinase
MGTIRRTGSGWLRSFFLTRAPGSRHGGPSAGNSKAGAANGLQWRLILAAGVGVGLLVTILFYYLPVFLINHYATVVFLLREGSVLREASILGVDTQEFGYFIGRYGMPALYLALTVLAASWVARRVRATGPLHGVLTGVVSGMVSAILSQAIGALYFGSGLEPLELVLYPTLAIVGGLAGGLRGWNVLAGREVLYRTSQDVGAASTPKAVAAAIGENLAGSEVSNVALWEATWPDGMPQEGVPGGFVLLGSWASPATRPPSPGVRLDAASIPALERLRCGQSWSMQRLEELRAPDRAALGARSGSVLLLPLVSTDESWMGLLTVASRRRQGFSRGARRAYLTLTAAVALTLENLRLVEQARRAGLIGERQRLAHEIHDTLAQGFASIVMNLEAADAILPAGHYSTQAQWHLGQARLTARESLAEARRLIWALRPKLLEEAPLPEALARLIERWSEASGIAAHATVTGSPRQLQPEVEATLFRVAQEALTNVRKHARANRTALTLSYMHDRVALDTRDDGTGFDPSKIGDATGSTHTGGFGLGTMRERVERLGGTLSIESAPGEGTTLAVDLPLAANDDPARQVSDDREPGVAVEEAS